MDGLHSPTWSLSERSSIAPLLPIVCGHVLVSELQISVPKRRFVLFSSPSVAWSRWAAETFRIATTRLEGWQNSAALVSVAIAPCVVSFSSCRFVVVPNEWSFCSCWKRELLAAKKSRRGAGTWICAPKLQSSFVEMGSGCDSGYPSSLVLVPNRQKVITSTQTFAWLLESFCIWIWFPFGTSLLVVCDGGSDFSTWTFLDFDCPSLADIVTSLTFLFFCGGFDFASSFGFLLVLSFVAWLLS